MKTALLALLMAACSPGPAPVSSSPRDPSNPAAPEGSPPPPMASAQQPPAEDHSHHGHAAAGDAGAVVYKCPMHPEVVSSTPGSCPKCGMHLVPKK
jgi:hypothetical protein